MIVLVLFLVFGWHSSTIEGIDRYYELVITRGIISPDGVARSALLVNGEFPGPPLTGTVGDIMHVNVVNRATAQDAIAVHFHGVSQKGTPWMDGAAYVTMCPLVKGSSFTHIFAVEKAGTHHYHAHNGVANTEGATGLLIFHDIAASEPYKYDGELHLVLSNWYHLPTAYLSAGMKMNPPIKAGKGKSVLLNGKGASEYCSAPASVLKPTGKLASTAITTDLDANTAAASHTPIYDISTLNLSGPPYPTSTSHMTSVTTTVTTVIETMYPDGSIHTDTEDPIITSSPPCYGKAEVLSVQPNRTYLLHVVNAAASSFLNLAIGGHDMTLVGLDGGYIQPITLKSLDLSGGQSARVLLHTNHNLFLNNDLKNSKRLIDGDTKDSVTRSKINNPNSFLIRAQTDWDGSDTSAASIGLGVLKYSSNPTNKLTSSGNNDGDDGNITESNAVLVDFSFEPPNESRNWDQWMKALQPLLPESYSTSRKAGDNLEMNKDNSPVSKSTVEETQGPTVPPLCPPNNAVDKRFVFMVKQQYVEVSTHHTFEPSLTKAGVAHTQAAWTMLHDTAAVLPPTPYLLGRYLGLFNMPVQHPLHSTLNEMADTTSAPTDSTSKATQADANSTQSSSSSQYQYKAQQQNQYVVHPQYTGASSPLRLEYNDVVDIIVQNTASVNGGCTLHPWHLHGHDFFVLGQGDGKFDPSKDPLSFNVDSPIQLNTVSGYASKYGKQRNKQANTGLFEEPCGWVAIRFVANNPGFWLFHCHNAWHLHQGMAVVFDSASERVKSEPPLDSPMCGDATAIINQRAFAAIAEKEKEDDEEVNRDNGRSVINQPPVIYRPIIPIPFPLPMRNTTTPITTSATDTAFPSFGNSGKNSIFIFGLLFLTTGILLSCYRYFLLRSLDRTKYGYSVVGSSDRQQFSTSQNEGYVISLMRRWSSYDKIYTRGNPIESNTNEGSYGSVEILPTVRQ